MTWTLPQHKNMLLFSTFQPSLVIMIKSQLLCFFHAPINNDKANKASLIIDAVHRSFLFYCILLIHTYQKKVPICMTSLHILK